MTNAVVFPPIISTPERRRIVIELMAADLAGPTIPDRGDSVRLLCTKGYSIVAVHCLVDEAIAVAYQAVVAKEMSES